MSQQQLAAQSGKLLPFEPMKGCSFEPETGSWIMWTGKSRYLAGVEYLNGITGVYVLGYSNEGEGVLFTYTPPV